MRISDWSSDVCSSDLLALRIGDWPPSLVAEQGDRDQCEQHHQPVDDCDAAAYRLGALLHALFSLRCRGHEDKPASVGVFIPLMMRTTSGASTPETARHSCSFRRSGGGSVCRTRVCRRTYANP